MVQNDIYIKWFQKFGMTIKGLFLKKFAAYIEGLGIVVKCLISVVQIFSTTRLLNKTLYSGLPFNCTVPIM